MHTSMITRAREEGPWRMAFHPQMTYVHSTHILLAKSNLMVLVNVKGWKDNHPHVPGSRRPEILVSGIKVFLRFQSWKTLSSNGRE